MIRRRMVDEAMKQMRNEVQQLDEKHETNHATVKRSIDDNMASNCARMHYGPWDQMKSLIGSIGVQLVPY